MWKVFAKLSILFMVLFCAPSCMCNRSGSSSDDSCVYGNAYKSFAGTYTADLTIMQSGHMTTIVLNPDGTGYFKEGESYDGFDWWPADNGGGIVIGVGLGNEDSRYYMNERKTRMYWGLDDYMNNKDGYSVKKIN